MNPLRVLFAVLAIQWTGLYAAAEFAAPETHEAALWEAEAAAGAWRTIEDPRASGGAYAEAAGDANEVVFEFRLPEKMRLLFWPRWWIHGEQKASVRFPRNVPYFHVIQVWPLAYPSPQQTNMVRPINLDARTGPDTIDYVGARAFFNAPESGKIGVLDPAAEKVVDVIDVGGYPAEVLCDRDARKLYVTDMLGDLLLVVDAETLAVQKRIPVPAEPRSMTMHNGKLFLISMKGKALTVLRLSDRSILKTVPLPHPPQHVDVVDGKIVIWYLPATFDPQTGSEHLPDRLAYGPPTHNSSTPWPRTLLDRGSYSITSSVNEEAAFRFHDFVKASP